MQETGQSYKELNFSEKSGSPNGKNCSAMEQTENRKWKILKNIMLVIKWVFKPQMSPAKSPEGDSQTKKRILVPSCVA